MNRFVRRARQEARTACRRLGFDLIRADQGAGYRQVALLRSIEATLVLDVGANAGQYGQELRRNGYRNRIVSFEPLSEAFSKLARTTVADSDWTAVHLALGDESGSATINVAENSYSSSILPMLPKHLDAAPDSGYVRTEVVPIATLDDVMPEYMRSDDKVFLKIDTQGFERQVLAGASESLGHIVGAQLELSLVLLYEQSMLFVEALLFMRDAGFALVELQPGFSHPVTGQLLQCDGLFIREDAAP
jgi:FkbM family methyltransferase